MIHFDLFCLAISFRHATQTGHVNRVCVQVGHFLHLSGWRVLVTKYLLWIPP